MQFLLYICVCTRTCTGIYANKSKNGKSIATFAGQEKQQTTMMENENVTNDASNRLIDVTLDTMQQYVYS